MRLDFLFDAPRLFGRGLVKAYRLSLPASADMLRLCRPGARSLRPVGRRLDDAGAPVALPSVGHFGIGLRAGNVAGQGALVPAVALRPLARRRRPPSRSSVSAIAPPLQAGPAAGMP